MVTRKKITDPDTKPQHGLKMKLDDMLTISPKTEKQKEFFDAYQQGHYFCALSGVAGTGKTYIALDTIITRIGHTSKFFLCGDYRQVDLKKRDDRSGLLEFLTILRSMKEFTEIEFSVADIVRSSLVKNYIIARIKYEDNK